MIQFGKVVFLVVMLAIYHRSDIKKLFPAICNTKKHYGLIMSEKTREKIKLQSCLRARSRAAMSVGAILLMYSITIACKDTLGICVERLYLNEDQHTGDEDEHHIEGQ